MIQRAITYARVSGDDRGKDGRNLAGQLEMCRDYVIHKGYALVAEMAEDDRGASGASFELEKLGEILELAKKRDFDVLVVREIDRLSRNLAKQLVVEEELNRSGIRIEYVLGEYADSPEGNLMKHVRAVVAEYEREKIKERIQRGKRLKVKAGSVMLPLDHPPFGYRIVKVGNLWQLEVYEPEAEIIRVLYNWYVHGDEDGKIMTLRSIAQRLTDLRIATPIDRKKKQGLNPGNKKRPLYEWSGSVIAHYLDREVYKGKWIYGRKSAEPIAVDVPPIVSKELWEAAHRIRKQKYVEGISVRKHSYLFARRIRCGLCSSVVVGTPVNGYLYYRCLALKKGKVIGVTCHAPHFRLEPVEQVVWDWIKQLLSDPIALQEGLEARLAETETQINPFRERLAVVESLIDQNNKELDRALELYLSNDFPKEMLISRKNELETALQSLEQEKARLVDVIEEQTLSPHQIEDIHEFARKIGAGLAEADQDFRRKRAIVDALDVRVVLSVEEGEKVVYAQCTLGEEEFKLDAKKAPKGGRSSGGEFRNISVENCEGCPRRNRLLCRASQALFGRARGPRQSPSGCRLHAPAGRFPPPGIGWPLGS